MYDENLFPHEVTLTPKENYLRMLDGEDFEYMPAFFNTGMCMWDEELLTPVMAPNGPIVTTLNVTYIGNKDLMNGAMPDPHLIEITDITKWRDQLKITDLSDFDFEDYYRKKMEPIDRENSIVPVGGADYFLTLISLMGFEEAMVSLYEEPEEVHALLDRIHEFYMMIYKKQLEYVKPDMLATMDDICSQLQPFVSLEHYREFFKPLEKDHYDLALERGMHITHHCCGKAEMLVGDWVEMGVQSWNPAQHQNDLVGVKKQYPTLAIEGGWDNIYWEGRDDMDELRQAVIDYIDRLAPGGHFGFYAMGGGDPFKDPVAAKRNDVVKQTYFDYGFDYYK